MATSGYYMAMAIQREGIELKVIDLSEASLPESWTERASTIFIDREEVGAGDFFVTVKTAIFKLFKRLYERMQTSEDGLNPLHHLGNVQAMAIACAGVIRHGSELIQLPLWNQPTFQQVVWHDQGVPKVYFKFKEEIVECLEAVALHFADHQLLAHIKAHRSQLYRKIRVYNDLAACAAAEWVFTRVKIPAGRSFAYIKAGGGLNVGLLSDGYEAKEPTVLNSEMGHIYSAVHWWDTANGFGGSCPFHSNCVEGMASASSFIRRAQLETEGNPFTAAWIQSGIQKHDPQSDRAFFNYITTKGDPHLREITTEIIAHYVSHLIHVILLGAQAPGTIVLGGYMMEGNVLEAVRIVVNRVINRYPLQQRLDPRRVADTITLSQYSDDQASAEVNGALALALKQVVS